jgi:hypothetical protein
MLKNKSRKSLTIINNFSNRTIKSNLESIKTKRIITIRKWHKRLLIYRKTISNISRKKLRKDKIYWKVWKKIYNLTKIPKLRRLLLKLTKANSKRLKLLIRTKLKHSSKIYSINIIKWERLLVRTRIKFYKRWLKRKID